MLYSIKLVSESIQKPTQSAQSVYKNLMNKRLIEYDESAVRI